jgi:hypothetical protein
VVGTGSVWLRAANIKVRLREIRYELGSGKGRVPASVSSEPFIDQLNKNVNSFKRTCTVELVTLQAVCKSQDV